MQVCHEKVGKTMQVKFQVNNGFKASFAEISLGVIRRPVKNPGDAEISELDHEARGDEDVLSLDVAVEDVAAVDVVDREAELEEDEEDELLVQLLAALRRDQGEQVPAHTEFHHNVHIIALVEGCL